MKEELDIDYNMSVENMLDMTKEQEIGHYKLITSEFYSVKGKRVKKNILFNKTEQKQIFQMKDGNFILEVEDHGMCEYYASKEIKELI